MPAGFELRECWPTTTRGRVSGSARDDDIDYTILLLGTGFNEAVTCSKVGVKFVGLGSGPAETAKRMISTR